MGQTAKVGGGQVTVESDATGAIDVGDQQVYLGPGAAGRQGAQFGEVQGPDQGPAQAQDRPATQGCAPHARH